MSKKNNTAAPQTTEKELIAVRRSKAQRVRERGDNPFANDVTSGDALMTLADVRKSCAHAVLAPVPPAAGGSANKAGANKKGKGARATSARYDIDQVKATPCRVAGRVLFVRNMGGVAFVRLRDRTDELQLYLDEATLGAALSGLDDIDLGDFVEAHGTTMATKRGELSVNVTSFRLLTKALRPLPTKTSFRDVETRYRRRYVDLVANTDVATVFKARSALVSAARRFFDERDFLEVETPTLNSLIGGATAKPFETHHNALDMPLFMRIAPELYLKRLVVGGFERVYELARCFRNEGVSTRHNPEFTMLEYYQAYATYDTLMDQTEELFRYLDDALKTKLPEAHATWVESRTFTLERFERVPMRKAFIDACEKAGIPHEAVLGGVDADDAPIKVWAKEAKGRKRVIDWANFRVGMKKADNPGERLFCAYEYVAEPFLEDDYRHGDKSVPVFVTDHPFEISPLARKKDSDPTLTDRFELFVTGKEICNAFSELNDPDDQRSRFAAQVEAKSRGADETMDYDADYVRALEYGMPPTAGFGMGVDRVVMILTGSTSIRDVILFPLLRPESPPDEKRAED